MISRQLERRHPVCSLQIQRVVGIQKHLDNVYMVPVHRQMQRIHFVLVSAKEIDASLRKYPHGEPMPVHASNPESVDAKIVDDLYIHCFVHQAKLNHFFRALRSCAHDWIDDRVPYLAVKVQVDVGGSAQVDEQRVV
jgi:hypothetical protein